MALRIHNLGNGYKDLQKNKAWPPFPGHISIVTKSEKYFPIFSYYWSNYSHGYIMKLLFPGHFTTTFEPPTDHPD